MMDIQNLLTKPQYRLYCHIKENDGILSASLSDIANALNMKIPTVVRSRDALVTKKLISVIRGTPRKGDLPQKKSQWKIQS